MSRHNSTVIQSPDSPSLYPGVPPAELIRLFVDGHRDHAIVVIPLP